MGFVNEKRNISKKSYFSLVLSERKVYCVFAFFLRSWIFFVPAVHAASRKPKFYTAFALSSSSRHRFFDPFLRGFLAQFSMFYWPAMYYYVAICRLAFVCNASVLCIWKALNKLWCSRMKKVCCIVLLAMKFQSSFDKRYCLLSSPQGQ